MPCRHPQDLASCHPRRFPGRRALGALAGVAVAAATLLLAAPAARAGVAVPSRQSIGTALGADPALTLVAEGCGPGRWRGPWGGCNGAGPWAWHGPVYEPVYGGNGCPPGSWRGPWGHCRDTPYHGALPGGGWR